MENVQNQHTVSTETLNQLLVSKIPEVKEAAERAKELVLRLEAKEISKSEFDELIDDLTRIDNIDRSMISLQRYNEIMMAIKIILTLKSLTSLF